MNAAIDLAAKLDTFTEAWQPRTVSLFNGHDLMVAKLRGDYHWHVHDDTDDFFLVLTGCLEIDLDDGTLVTLHPGQIVLIEPTGTPNSGDARTAAPRRVI